MKSNLLIVDPFAGASGDMWLGALVDAGAPLSKIEAALNRLSLKGWRLRKTSTTRAGLRACRIEVTSQTHRPRTLKEITSIVRKARLSPWVTQRAVQVFEALVRAEARVHGRRKASGALHILGEDDTLLDVVGTIAALEVLEVEKIFSTPVGVGWGTIQHDGAQYPAEGPAAAELLKGFSIRPVEEGGERVTPTGAALLSVLAEPILSWPEAILESVGYGAGSRQGSSVANVLRVWVARQAAPKWADDRILVAEAHIDDASPLVHEPLMDRLFKMGALDVTTSPIQMKKNRPALKLTVLLRPEDRDRISDLIFRESTTLGLRFTEVFRRRLRQEMRQASLPYGRVRVKVGFLNGELVTASPEYEDCHTLSAKHRLPFKTVYREAQAKILDNPPSSC